MDLERAIPRRTWAADVETAATVELDLDRLGLGDVHDGPATRRAVVPAGHAAAERALQAYDVRSYAKTRNHLAGNVSRLGPYLTWGVFTPAEVQHAVERQHAPLVDADLRKFRTELGWKAYARTWFAALGSRVFEPLEPYKYPTPTKLRGAPPGATTGTTGLPCIDAIARELLDSGYLHNHQRLWFAAWWVHYQGYDPRDGETFFRRHLLDGEPGPNALGWQWVASTFAGKPYLFNAANMRKYGLEGCEGAPFDDSYEALVERYLGGYGSGGYARRPNATPHARPSVLLPRLEREPTARPAVLLHAERLSLRARALLETPDAPVIVFLDGRRLRRERPSKGRTAFAVGLAADLVRRLRDEGRAARLVLAEGERELAMLADHLGADGFVAPGSWHPGTWRTLDRLDALRPVAVRPDVPYADVDASLRSFSAWWKKARPQVEARGHTAREAATPLFDRRPAGP